MAPIWSGLFSVRYDNGATDTVRQDDIRDMRAGERVRVEGGRVYRMEGRRRAVCSSAHLLCNFMRDLS